MDTNTLRDNRGNNVYTVGQVNSYLQRMFACDAFLCNISVKGEVSNCKYHSSKHIYFTMKDSSGAISCVMFASNRSGLGFKMEDGQQIIVSGSLKIYEKTGSYQLYARSIEPAGEGNLYVQFEKLKKELEERGMFSPMYKKEIPRYVKTVGVVTSGTGAAVRDIINVATRRNPYIQLIIYPAIVQGEDAPDSIIRGIQALERKSVDVMIVGRGGGSIEDLWAFNEERVAQAIFDSSIPIISAVGHETDTTIVDFVSDLRAPTPSAAAELAVRDIQELFGQLRGYREILNRDMQKKLKEKMLDAQNRKLRLNLLSPISQLKEKKNRAQGISLQLENRMKAILSGKKQQFLVYTERLKGVSPLEKLTQGYAYVATEDGRTLQSVGGVKKGENLLIYLRDGLVHANVTGKEEMLWEKKS